MTQLGCLAGLLPVGTAPGKEFSRSSGPAPGLGCNGGRDAPREVGHPPAVTPLVDRKPHLSLRFTQLESAGTAGKTEMVVMTPRTAPQLACRADLQSAPQALLQRGFNACLQGNVDHCCPEHRRTESSMPAPLGHAS